LFGKNYIGVASLSAASFSAKSLQRMPMPCGSNWWLEPASAFDPRIFPLREVRLAVCMSVFERCCCEAQWKIESGLLDEKSVRPEIFCAKVLDQFFSFKRNIWFHWLLFDETGEWLNPVLLLLQVNVRFNGCVLWFVIWSHLCCTTRISAQNREVSTVCEYFDRAARSIQRVSFWAGWSCLRKKRVWFFFWFQRSFPDPCKCFFVDGLIVSFHHL